MQFDLGVLLGPLGLTIGLVYLVWMLITERVVPQARLADSVRREADLRKEVDRALGLVRGSNEAVERMAASVEARNKMEAERATRAGLTRHGDLQESG